MDVYVLMGKRQRRSLCYKQCGGVVNAGNLGPGPNSLERGGRVQTMLWLCHKRIAVALDMGRETRSTSPMQ